MLKPRKTAGELVADDKCRNDLRLEMKVKNNVLWHAIYDRYGSVLALCKQRTELKNQFPVIYNLLRFKVHPFKKVYNAHTGKLSVTREYRRICLLLETTLGVPVEDLFPEHLYERLIDVETEKVLEVSSFSALPTAVRQEVRNLPAPVEESPIDQASRRELSERVQKVLKSLAYREREIVKLLYGIPDGCFYSVEEVAHIFGVGKERIRQIERKAIIKLQQPSRSQELLSFWKES